jgi:hypothetical protein
MLEEKTIEAIRALASQLKPAERLNLIRVIIETQPTAEDATVDSGARERDWSEQLDREAAYWYARSAEERRPYLGQYVAVHAHKVIDHDADRRALYLRVQSQLPNTPVLLVAAEATAPREFTVRNPRLERMQP